MSSIGDFLRDHASEIVPIAVLVVWLLLQLWILPKLGVST
jgi:hypothetical protein